MHIAVAGHVTEISGPVQALYNFLRRTEAHFSFARHPFGYTTLRASIFEHWHGQDLRKRRELSSPRVLSVARDVIANLVWFSFQERSDIFIGIDNVNAFCGILLRKLGRTRRCVYYVIDYTPVRFTNRFWNAVYHRLDKFVVRHCDEIWNISERIAKVRESQGVRAGANRVVGVGVDFEHIVIPDTRKVTDLVVVSHLTEGKGVQLAIAAMKRIRESVPDAKLFIIGTGPFEAHLRELAAQLEPGDAVSFLGAMDHRQLFAFMPSCGIALAPYTEDPASITYYADPTKPKEYLACGLPVVITDVPWIAQEIAQAPMGICIRYDAEELAKAVVRLVNDPVFYNTCVENARGFVARMTWDSIYLEALAPHVLKQRRNHKDGTENDENAPDS